MELSDNKINHESAEAKGRRGLMIKEEEILAFANVEEPCGNYAK